MKRTNHLDKELIISTFAVSLSGVLVAFLADILAANRKMLKDVKYKQTVVGS